MKIKKLTRIARVNQYGERGSVILDTIYDNSWLITYKTSKKLNKHCNYTSYSEIFKKIQTEEVFAHERLTYGETTVDVVAILNDVQGDFGTIEVYEMRNYANSYFTIDEAKAFHYQEMPIIKGKLKENLNTLTEKAVTMFNECYTVEIRYNIEHIDNKLYSQPEAFISYTQEKEGLQYKHFLKEYKYHAARRFFSNQKEAERYSKDLSIFESTVDVNAFNSIEDARSMLYVLNMSF